MTSPGTGATATSKDGLDWCRAYFFRVRRKEIKEALLAGWRNTCFARDSEETLVCLFAEIMD